MEKKEEIEETDRQRLNGGVFAAEKNGECRTEKSHGLKVDKVPDTPANTPVRGGTDGNKLGAGGGEEEGGG